MNLKKFYWQKYLSSLTGNNKMFKTKQLNDSGQPLVNENIVFDFKKYKKMNNK